VAGKTGGITTLDTLGVAWLHNQPNFEYWSTGAEYPKRDWPISGARPEDGG